MNMRTRSDRTPKTKEEEQRPDNRSAERVSMARSQILDSRQREGYSRRWVNLNVVGRREQLEAAWWKPVLDAEGNETKVSKSGSTMLLMEIPLEYFKEDIAAGQQKVTDVVKENQRLAQDEYTPDGRSPLQRDSVV
jgi:hypothetical protein